LRLLGAVGSPSRRAETRRALPGPAKGRRSGLAVRYRAIRKPTKKPRMKQPTAAKAA
jgi:hypothetical protein